MAPTCSKQMNIKQGIIGMQISALKLKQPNPKCGDSCVQAAQVLTV